MSDGGDWESERMEATYAEARAVLDAQNDTMGDIDSKAMRTVRFNVLLVGVLIAAARFAGSSVFNPALLHLSVGCLVLSAILGIVTYNESDLFVGPQGSYVERLAHGGPTDSRWDRHLLETFGGMISENSDDIDWNSGLLTTTQGTLIVGIVSGVLAVLI
ncbi:hypothetical protein SAMN05216559_4129 [Halomicrobium zhouii]|uniref:Integral membrane protein n=1 Tax=Halomicrobium zhouii TaxID=767519 RepID=A0A1I6MAP1_9EURY|nr:hypothetical protein [Halomicrobium zhouii]SFS12794.1 hypothetical protein SAMN05216559_4129 [Halomicrobium zhouii]